MEINLEKIELVKERTGCTYAEAKEALEKTEGSVVDAIIAVEETMNKAYDAVDGASLKDSPIFAKMKEIVDKGNVSRILIRKEEKIIVNFPLTAGVIGAVLVPWGAILGIVAALGTQCDIEFVDDKGDVVDINGKVVGFYDKAKGYVMKGVDAAQSAFGGAGKGTDAAADKINETADAAADKVDDIKEAFERAKGKLLFIDEAYSLVEYHEGGYGDEAINTIVQEMENNRDKTIVIFAGYPDKMKEFIARNPGLRSRVPFRITFEDYSAEDMVKIAESEAEKNGFSIDGKAKEKVLSICKNTSENPVAGNGRFCRNLVESAILDYAGRVYGYVEKAGEKDCVLRAEDFSVPEIISGEKKNIIGFRA